MRMFFRGLFPACACLGPFLMVVGLRGRTTFGFESASAGALMTSAALLVLFFDQTVDGTRTVTPRERRKRLLFWCVLIAIGVLIYLTNGWLMGWR